MTTATATAQRHVQSWMELFQAWGTGWRAAFDRAVAEHSAAVSANPEAYRKQVETFDRELRAEAALLVAARNNWLKLWKAAPTSPEVMQANVNLTQLEQRYRDVATGFYSGVTPIQPAARPTLGNPVLILGLVVVGIAAICWAVSSVEYTTNLREQTAFLAADLEARVQASKEGRTLQPGPNKLPGDKPDGDGTTGWVIGGLVLVGVAAGGLYFLNRPSA